MKHTFRMSVIMNIGNYENVRIDREVTIDDHELNDEQRQLGLDGSEVAKRYVEERIANDILQKWRLRDSDFNGTFASRANVRARQRDALKRYRLDHVIEDE